MDISFFFLMLLVVFGSAIIATFATFGFTALFLAVLALFIPLPQAIAITGLVDLTNGIARGYFFRNKIDWKLVLYYGIPGVIFSLLGSLLIQTLDTQILEKIVGAVLLCFGIYKLSHIRIHALAPSIATLVGGGVITGFLAGLVGAGGALRSAFLSNYKLSVASFIATTTLIEILVDIARAGGYITSIKLSSSEWQLILACIPVSFLGVWLASKYAKKLSENQFRIILSIFLIIFGLKYLLSI